MLTYLIIEQFDINNIQLLNYWIPSLNELYLIIIIFFLWNIRNLLLFYLNRNYGFIIFSIIEIFYIKLISKINNLFFRGILTTFSIISFIKMLSFYWRIIPSSNNNNKELKESHYTVFQFFRYTYMPTFIFEESLIYTKFPFFDFIMSIFQFILFQPISIILGTLYLYPSLLKVYNEVLNNNLYLRSVLLLITFSILTWILSFYTFFGCYLKILSYLCFYDIPTYKIWWDCKSIREYWRLWNFQIYDFMRIYLVPRIHSFKNLKVFMFSAILHEYISIIMFQKVLGIAFFAMFSQAFLMEIEKIISWENGNMFFWICNCVFGQPICLFLIYYLL